MAITIWYPAQPSTARAVTFAELARLGAYQAYTNPPATAFDDAAAAAAKDTADSALASTTRSHRDAPPRGGKHPLILFAHSTPIGQVAMAEALASQGFVVAGLMSRGAAAGAYRLSIDDVRAMAEDLDVARRRLEALPFVDGSRVGVIGMSNGALGAVGLANRRRVAAIVSLDGTIGERAAGRVLPELPQAAAPVSRTAMLHFYTTPNDYLDLSYLRGRPDACTAIHVPAVRHADFLSYAVLKPRVPGETPPRTDVQEKFAAISRIVVEFLTAQLAPAQRPATLALRDSDRAIGLALSPCQSLP